MQKMLEGKKVRVGLLIALAIVALAEILFRSIVVGELALSTSNAGEQVTVLVMALVTLLLIAKNNDKLSYVACGALIAYFVMDQLFELPGMIAYLVANFADVAVAIAIAVRILTMVGVVAIGVLLAEYVNDGSIYNRAFTAIFWITVLLHVAIILFQASGLIFLGLANDAPADADVSLLLKQVALIIFNDVYRVVMVFLFTAFAYDSAKRQLKRENIAE